MDVFADIIDRVGGNQDVFEREWDSRVLSPPESKKSSSVFDAITTDELPSSSSSSHPMGKKAATEEKRTSDKTKADADSSKTKKAPRTKLKPNKTIDKADEKKERAKPRQFSKRWRNAKRLQLAVDPILKRGPIKNTILNMIQFLERDGKLGDEVLRDNKDVKKIASIRMSAGAADLIREEIERVLAQDLRNARFIQQAARLRDPSLEAPGSKPTTAQKYGQNLEGSFKDIERRKEQMEPEVREAYEKMCRARDDCLTWRTQDMLLPRFLRLGEKFHKWQGCLGRE